MVLDQEIRNKPITEMTREEMENFEEAKKFFDFYKEIDMIKEYTAEDFQILYQQMTRHIIIKVLGKGIDDYYPGTNDLRKRHAMSAMEILENVNDMIDKEESGKFKDLGKLKKANLFFHINKLEDAGFLREIGVVKSGRRRTTYFGRTAMIFITMEMDDEPSYSLLNNENFVNFIKEFSPEKSDDEINQVLTQLAPLNYKDSRYYIDWVQKHDEKLRNNHINFVELLKFFSLMHRFPHEAIDGLADLAKLLQIDTTKLTKDV